ncbi:ROK family protein [Pseudoroseicyclus sp. H15]
MLGISRAQATNLSRDLLDTGLIYEAETVYGQGRPSIRLGLNPGGGYLIGVSLDHDPCAVVLTDLQGKDLASATLPLSGDPAALGQSIAALLPKLCAEAGITADRIVAIGLAVPGFVDADQQTCLQSSFMGWRDRNVAAEIREVTGIATYIENDANAVALGERLFGRARQCDDFLLVSLGTGIGGAMFIDGKLRRGHGGGAGELSHATIEPGGPPCRCGKRGCLTTIASGRAIVADARAAGLQAGSLEEVETLADQGNTDAIAILHRAGGALGLSVSHAVQMLNPELVLIVLQIGSIDGLMHRVVSQTLETNLLPRFAARTRIEFETVSAAFWARGAAAVAAERFLLTPPPPLTKDEE